MDERMNEKKKTVSSEVNVKNVSYKYWLFYDKKSFSKILHSVKSYTFIEKKSIFRNL